MKPVLLCFALLLLVVTFSCEKEKKSLPILTTNEVWGISQRSALSGGYVTDNGGASILARGVCWNKSSGPTISNNHTTEIGDTGFFVSTLNGLKPGTSYYVRAYATNKFGTGYGNEVNFESGPVQIAVVSTDLVSSIRSTTAVSGGVIDYDGGDASVTSKGICWSTTVNPTLDNFHTMDGRYKPFADLLTKDGYVVNPLKDEIGQNTLEDVDILVISNSLNIRNTQDWTLPTPSAFTEDEISNIVSWVKDGGSLFLIADHMPFPGAAGELASTFGFELNNGFAYDTFTGGSPDLFTIKEGTLKANSITNGRNELEKVDSIYSFTGEAFQIPEDAAPVLILNENFISLMLSNIFRYYLQADFRINLLELFKNKVLVISVS